MGRGSNRFRASNNSFDRVLGPRRGITDGLASDNPSERAVEELEAIEAELNQGHSDHALEALNRFPSQVENKPLLGRLADSLCEAHVDRQISEGANGLRQLADDLDIVSQTAETLVERDGLIHLWPEGLGQTGVAADSRARAVCGTALNDAFRAERGSWVSRREARCSECDQSDHLPECDEEADYNIFDSDLDRDRREAASSSLRFSIGQQLTNTGHLHKDQLNMLGDEALSHADYEALARQAERNQELILCRLFPDLDSPKPQRPIHWYSHLRAAGERSGRAGERRLLLQERLRPLIEA